MGLLAFEGSHLDLNFVLSRASSAARFSLSQGVFRILEAWSPRPPRFASDSPSRSSSPSRASPRQSRPRSPIPREQAGRPRPIRSRASAGSTCSRASPRAPTPRSRAAPARRSTCSENAAARSATATPIATGAGRALGIRGPLRVASAKPRSRAFRGVPLLRALATSIRGLGHFRASRAVTAVPAAACTARPCAATRRHAPTRAACRPDLHPEDRTIRASARRDAPGRPTSAASGPSTARPDPGRHGLRSPIETSPLVHPVPLRRKPDPCTRGILPSSACSSR